jgi:hypothetical protein
VIVQVFGSGKPSSSLSVRERLDAIGTGLERGGVEDVWLLVGATAGLLLLIGTIAWLVSRGRRRRWIAYHQRSLAAAGLHDEELALVRRVARRCAAAALPLLTRRSAAFDVAAAELVRRHRPASERRELLARLLSLRRRVPFERRYAPPPDFDRGLPVLLFLRVGRGEPLRMPGRIVAVTPTGLQLSLDDEPETRAVAPRLRAGQEAAFVVERGSLFEEARVRIRGVGEGPLPQLLVDRPATLSPSRVRVVWRDADERVRVELVERFSARQPIDAAPRIEGRVVAASSEGVIVRFKIGRPRLGEAVRLVDGERAGHFRGYAVLEARNGGGEVFLLQRGGERPGDAPDGTVEPVEPRPRTMEEAAS